MVKGSNPRGGTVESAPAPGDAPAPAPSTRCPAVHVADFTPCPPAEVDPLVAWLRRREAPDAPVVFPRGTALPDGRLDLCKQALGFENTERVLDAAADHPWLRRILLGTNAIGDDGAAALAARLQRAPGDGGLPALDTLYLGCNRIGARGVGALASALEALPQVTALWLKRNPLGVDAAPRLARLMVAQPALTVLDLTNTELGPRGAAIIADALPDSGVEHLMLGAQGLAPEAGAFLARALARSPRLRSLSLAVNALGDAGIASLAEGIAACASTSSLERLDLSSNGIGLAGLTPLFAALERHPRLRELELGRARSTLALAAAPNRLGRAAGAVIAAFVARATPLDGLGLASTDLGSRGVYPIVEALGTRARPLAYLRLGAGVAKVLRRRAAAHVAHVVPPPPPHVAAIQSVYR